MISEDLTRLGAGTMKLAEYSALNGVLCSATGSNTFLDIRLRS